MKNLFLIAFILIMSDSMDCEPSRNSSTNNSDDTYYPSPGGFNGWVIEHVTTLKYISGAKVCFKGADRCALTSNSGGYSLSAESSGTHYIVTTHPDYYPDTVKAYCKDYSFRLNIKLIPIDTTQ